jgi:hypothetical protein
MPIPVLLRVAMAAGTCLLLYAEGAVDVNDAILYLPCYDSDPAFEVLKPRQQFLWASTPGKVELLARSGSCLTAAANVGNEGPLRLRECVKGLKASQNWSFAALDSSAGGGGLATAWGFTVCGDIPVPGTQVNWPSSAPRRYAPVQRNYRGWITSTEVTAPPSSSSLTLKSPALPC